MRILDITSRIPFPLIDGARIVMHQTIVGLVRSGHHVTVVAIDEEDTRTDELRELVELHVVSVRVRSRVAGALRTLFSPRPFSQVRKDRPEVYALLDRLQASAPFDVVIADQAHIAQYGAYMKRTYGVPYVLRSHNVEHEIYRRHVPTIANPILRRYVAVQADRWERFEREQHRAADACIAITERDAAAISAMAPGVPIATIPVAVDLSAFPYTDPETREPNSLVLLGNMAWPPNRISLLWFTREILPLIRESHPDTVVHVIGDNPPRSELPPESPVFQLHGRVDRIADYYGRITIGVIPLVVGGGMRVKMVEMMSSGMPIVATQLGAEGNASIPGVHYLSGNTPSEFAQAVVRLLEHPDERCRLARNARALAEEAYDLDRNIARVDEIIQDLVSGRVHA